MKIKIIHPSSGTEEAHAFGDKHLYTELKAIPKWIVIRICTSVVDEKRSPILHSTS